MKKVADLVLWNRGGTFIDFCTVLNGERHHYELFIIDFADDSVLTYAISPQSSHISGQALPTRARVTFAHHVSQEVPYPPSDRLIKFLKLFLSNDGEV